MSSEGMVGKGVLAAGEAQHCLQLHPEANLLGVTVDHLRQAGGRVLSGVSGCVYLVHWILYFVSLRVPI